MRFLIKFLQGKKKGGKKPTLPTILDGKSTEDMTREEVQLFYTGKQKN